MNSTQTLFIGTAPEVTETLKKNFKKLGIEYRVSIVEGSREVYTLKQKDYQYIFIQSNIQNSKIIRELNQLKLHFPQSKIILISPKVDLNLSLSVLRTGIFDILAFPLQDDEIETFSERLKLHSSPTSASGPSPERAVLHLFVRPEHFESREELSSVLWHYLNYFLVLNDQKFFKTPTKLRLALKEKGLIKNDKQDHKLQRFLVDPYGLIFGLNLSQSGKLVFLLKHQGHEISLVSAENQSPFSIIDIFGPYLKNMIHSSLKRLHQKDEKDQVEQLALTDEVTGAYNQRKLLSDLDHYIQLYQQEQRPFNLLFIDIDFFKNVNDQFGHVVGSQLLIDMAAVLRHELRSSDLVYRYGGDEFIVLLPKASLEETKRIALRISESVKGKEFMIQGGIKYRLSLSIGLAEYPTDATSAKAIIDFADRMMYMSKKSGRGKVFHVTEVL